MLWWVRAHKHPWPYTSRIWNSEFDYSSTHSTTALHCTAAGMKQLYGTWYLYTNAQHEQMLPCMPNKMLQGTSSELNKCRYLCHCQSRQQCSAKCNSDKSAKCSNARWSNAQVPMWMQTFRQPQAPQSPEAKASTCLQFGSGTFQKLNKRRSKRQHCCGIRKSC